MTWEETIQMIRTKEEFRDLVEKTYLEEDLILNVERFRKSEEFADTLDIIQSYAPAGRSVLDIGCGNGISSISLALKGFEVTAVEPDPSHTVGAGAIRKLIARYSLDAMEVHEELAENIRFPGESFDIVYVRQAMHHAYDLKKFIRELARVLKKGGLLLTVRDHVIFDEADKQRFLRAHPLHKFYGGENAYTSKQYREAMESAGLRIKKELKHYDSVINYFPMTKEEFETLEERTVEKLRNNLRQKIGWPASWAPVFNLYKKQIGFSPDKLKDEQRVAGRMYSYIALKS